MVAIIRVSPDIADNFPKFVLNVRVKSWPLQKRPVRVLLRLGGVLHERIQRQPATTTGAAASYGQDQGMGRVALGRYIWLGIGQEQGLTTAALAVVIAVRDAVLLEVDVLAVRAAEVRVSFFFVHLDRLLQLDLRLLQLALRRLQLGQKFLQRNG